MQLKVLEIGSNSMKEKVTITVEAVTVYSENAWVILAYYGVPIQLEAV